MEFICGEQGRKLESFQENTNPRGEPLDKTHPTTVLEINKNLNRKIKDGNINLRIQIISYFSIICCLYCFKIKIGKYICAEFPAS